MSTEKIVNGNAKDDEISLVPIKPYPETDEIKTLVESFEEKFGTSPEFIVRVPGRVNLIGEHVDYCGYSVLPMAIKQHVLVAVRTIPEHKLHLSNIDEIYEDYETDISDLTINVVGPPKWYQYFLCGVRGVLEDLEEESKGVKDGFEALVMGTIPPSAGLSSSSALVCAAVLTTAKIYDHEKKKLEYAELAARSERYIGTQGGGMDQAIAFLATSGNAKLISFNPLACSNIVLPEGAVFVVANSLVQMNKAATSCFNTRVAECRLVSNILAKRMNLQWQRYSTLGELQKMVGFGMRHFRALAVETLQEKPFTRLQLCYELQINEESLKKLCLTPNTENVDSFKLKERLKHVATEVERTQEFVRLCKACETGDESRDAALWKLGNIMKDSHASLRDLYECSHKYLDAIVNIAEKHTYGARLTGAGWGGCTVAITTAEKADGYVKALKDEFYSKKGVNEEEFKNAVFVTEPGDGAMYYVPNLN